jgi:hypothetical protein
MGKPTIRLAIDRQWHSRVLDVQSFKAADCENDHYLVVPKVRKRVSLNKKRLQISYGEVQSQEVK